VLSIHQNDGAVSLASNILRTGRWVLDFIHKLEPETDPPMPGGRVVSSQELHSHNQPTYTIEEASKERARQMLTKVIRPIASLIARAGYGPELMVHAIKR